MIDRACAYCTKRLPIATGDLECRARPPIVDIGRYGRFPVVRPTDYCHDGFEVDDKARAALKAAQAETRRLDGLAADTQKAAAAPDPDVNLEAPVVTPKRSRRAAADASQDKLL